MTENSFALGDISVEIEPTSNTEEEAVYRCLMTLYGSKEGEQALDRSFGLNTDCVSYPVEAAQALLTAEIIRKTKTYEPRAQVQRVEYNTEKSLDGYIKPKVVVKLV